MRRPAPPESHFRRGEALEVPKQEHQWQQSERAEVEGPRQRPSLSWPRLQSRLQRSAKLKTKTGCYARQFQGVIHNKCFVSDEMPPPIGMDSAILIANPAIPPRRLLLARSRSLWAML